MTYNKRKKVNTCLLSLLLAISIFAFSGCGVFSLNRIPENSRSEETTADHKNDITDFRKYDADYNEAFIEFEKYTLNKDYSGGACKIVTSGRDVITPDETTSTVMSEEFSNRNAAVGKVLNLSIVSETVDIDTMYEQLRQSMLSESYFADIVMIPQNKISGFAALGVIRNLRSMPSFDYSARFLFSTSVAAGGGGDAVYGVASYASLEPDSLCGIYFNKDILSSLGLESPYALVKKGEWTVEKYKEYAAAASAAGYAVYGAESTSEYLTDLFYFSQGGRLIDYQIGQFPTLLIGGEQSLNIARSASSVVNTGPAVFEGAVDSFAGGKSLFLIEKLSCVKTLADAACNWGLLPLPKYSADQQSYSSLAVSDSAMFFALPTGAPDYTMSGDVINAVSIMSYGYTADAYVTDAMYYYLRDNSSAEMMGIIMSNPVYDGAYTFADRNDAVWCATYGAIRSNTYGTQSVENAVGYWADSFTNSMYNNFTVD